MIQSLTIYDLNQAFKQGISLFYSASYGSLQAAVKNLLQKGWIVFEEKVDTGRNKKVYSITETGKVAFYAWMLSEVPENKLEVTALAKIYFLGLIPDINQKKLIVSEIMSKIQTVQEKLSEMNETINQLEIPDSYQEILRYQLKTLDYGIRSHQTAREWFQELLDNLV